MTSLLGDLHPPLARLRGACHPGDRVDEDDSISGT